MFHDIKLWNHRKQPAIFKIFIVFVLKNLAKTLFIEDKIEEKAENHRFSVNSTRNILRNIGTVHGIV